MKPELKSIIGRQLYFSLLPQIYRTEDNGDLARFLDSSGMLLDLVRNTLAQRLADSFPDNPFEGRACQDWILPYLAQLLDARLLSPHLEGRRTEVADAVAWRQRKGTRPCVEMIAEGVGQKEVEVQEGWQRVITTPQIGFPLLPENAFGQTVTHNPADPMDMARHPGLPAVTPDFRLLSRAVLSDPGHPQQRERRDGTLWRQLNPHGAPCFPDSHEDVSLRTVDFRTPSWREGRYHPRRVLLYAPPPVGFFPPDMTRFTWGNRNNHPDLFERIDDTGKITLHNPSGAAAMITTKPPNFTDDVTYTVRGIHAGDTLTFKAGRVILENLAARRVVIDVTPGTEPVIDARNCLFDELEVTAGTARLEYCTIRVKARFQRVEASDCIFPEDATIAGIPGEIESCIRYSRIPKSFLKLHISILQPKLKNNTTETPVFQTYRFCKDNTWHDASIFGEPGYGVLHPATPESVRQGAEDRNEMGAYHHAHYNLADEAVLDKLTDFLPVGLEAVMIQDPRLHAQPPQLI
ncbi:MAG: phage tail protein [Acidobacteriota bacterium]|nr:phage tail protein [Acidobacteriota bacterium]